MSKAIEEVVYQVINLEPAQEKMYRQLVTQAGLKIPRSLALSAD